METGQFVVRMLPNKLIKIHDIHRTNVLMVNNFRVIKVVKSLIIRFDNFAADNNFEK